MFGSFSRREFMRLTGFALLGAVAAACGKKKVPAEGETLDQIIAGRSQDIVPITAGTELLPSTPERVAFGIARPQPENSLIPNLSGRCWVATSRTAKALGPFPFTYHGDGLGEKGVYEATITFPVKGSYLLFVEADQGSKKLNGGAQINVGRQTAMPIPGERAIAVATPTVANHRGVEPICTRKPACSMHPISLDAALTSGTPTVLIIATPAFCKSQLCGPEVDIVQDVSTSFAGKINFVHVEVYKDDKPDTITRQILSPAAIAWRLDQEPAIYYIAKDGVISARSLGPVDRADVRSAVTALASA